MFEIFSQLPRRGPFTGVNTPLSENGNLTDRGFDLMTETEETIADEADWNEYCDAHPEVWTEYFDELYEEDEETA